MLLTSPLSSPLKNPARDVFSPAASSQSLTAQVQALFAGGKVGGMWDMGDTSTLFQDAAGATPVTAVTQPIGRVNDKSGLGNHATQATAGSRPLFSALKNLLVKTEQLDDGGLNSGIWKRRANVVVTPNQGSGGFSDLDRIENSVGSGAHEGLYQATAVAAANKTFTAQVTLAAVSGTTTAVLFIGAFGGGDVGNSAVVSLTTTPTTFTVSHTFGAGAVGNCYLEIAPNVVGVPILAGRAQLEFGAIATSYQRVNTASDYDTVGFPAFAQFDATDDALLFPAITFGGAFNTFVAGKLTGGTLGVHLWRTADSSDGYWAVYQSGSAASPTGRSAGSPTYSNNGIAVSPQTRAQIYTLINGVDSVLESTGIVLSAETPLQLSGYPSAQFQGNTHHVLMISGTLTAAEKLLCRRWAAEGNGAPVV